MAEFNRLSHANRVIHFYDINFGFNDDSLPHGHFVELFRQIIAMSEKRDESRYFRSGDKRLFIQGIKFVPDIEQVHGKLRAVRLDVSPEILNMKTDTARDIDMAEEEGIVETTHFVISYKNKKKRLAVEYNAAGAKTHELGRYLEHIGVKAGLQSVVITPVLAGDSLSDFLNRVGKLSELEISAPKDSIAEVKKYNPGLASAMEASKDFFKCDTLILKPQFDIKNKAETGVAKEFVSTIIKAWKQNPLRRGNFESFKVKGQDSEKNGTLELFDLLKDDEKSKIKVEKRLKTRILNSDDMFTKIVSIMTKKRII
ncbi:hypothetical protein GO988_21680 [Hymenobacter sp. HMF4947]|uniref:DUF4747 family protein n=1 Tax=Hymenobacter ginkgonis TaxID=2682976 RepID=A0A7K1TKK8_9BACT|nr:hypothetical protein [Hymenobacter ginkgonis]MVN78949.1 hypothetical protein [Hymenobacter ginkgonis]